MLAVSLGKGFLNARLLLTRGLVAYFSTNPDVPRDAENLLESLRRINLAELQRLLQTYEPNLDSHTYLKPGRRAACLPEIGGVAKLMLETSIAMR